MTGVFLQHALAAERHFGQMAGQFFGKTRLACVLSHWSLGIALTWTLGLLRRALNRKTHKMSCL